MQSPTSNSPSDLGRMQRVASRIEAKLPIGLDGARGATLNISATGVYFEIDAVQSVGSQIQFVIQVEVQGEQLDMVCKGEVVRVELINGKMGVAVKLANSYFTDSTWGSV